MDNAGSIEKNLERFQLQNQCYVRTLSFKMNLIDSVGRSVAPDSIQLHQTEK